MNIWLNLCYHCFITVSKASGSSRNPSENLEGSELYFFLKVVSNVWSGRPNLPYQAFGPWSYLQMSLRARFFLSSSLLASLFFIWPKPQVFHFNHSLSSFPFLPLVSAPLLCKTSAQINPTISLCSNIPATGYCWRKMTQTLEWCDQQPFCVSLTTTAIPNFNFFP